MGNKASCNWRLILTYFCMQYTEGLEGAYYSKHQIRHDLLWLWEAHKIYNDLISTYSYFLFIIGHELEWPIQCMFVHTVLLGPGRTWGVLTPKPKLQMLFNYSQCAEASQAGQALKISLIN